MAMRDVFLGAFFQLIDGEMPSPESFGPLTQHECSIDRGLLFLKAVEEIENLGTLASVETALS